MKTFTCTSMRTAIVLSVGLLILAMLFLAPVMLISKPLPYLVNLMVYPGFASLIASPLVLTSAAVISLLPSVNAQLQNCQH